MWKNAKDDFSNCWGCAVYRCTFVFCVSFFCVCVAVYMYAKLWINKRYIFAIFALVLGLLRITSRNKKTHALYTCVLCLSYSYSEANTINLLSVAHSRVVVAIVERVYTQRSAISMPREQMRAIDFFGSLCLVLAKAIAAVDNIENSVRFVHLHRLLLYLVFYSRVKSTSRTAWVCLCNVRKNNLVDFLLSNIFIALAKIDDEVYLFSFQNTLLARCVHGDLHRFYSRCVCVDASGGCHKWLIKSKIFM